MTIFPIFPFEFDFNTYRKDNDHMVVVVSKYIMHERKKLVRGETFIIEIHNKDMDEVYRSMLKKDMKTYLMKYHKKELINDFWL